MTNGKSLLLSALALLLFATPALAEEVIKLGVASSLTGDLAGYGIPTLNAAEVVAEELNAKGGVLGKKIVVIPQDDQCKPELATNAATKLVSDKVDIIVGHICSGATNAAMPIYNSAKIISMSSAATTPSLTTSGENPYFFRTIANDNVQAKLSALFAANTLKSKRIALIHDNGDYGKGYTETNRNVLQEAGKGDTIILFEAVNPDAVDYSATVRKLKKENTDTVIFGGYHPTAAKLVQQMARERVKVNFIGPDSLKDDAFIRMAGKNSDGVYASSPSDTSHLPIFKVAREQHLKKYNAEPGVFYYNAYAAAQTLLNAIAKAGTTDTAKVIEMLRKETVDTPAGKISFSKSGDPLGVGLSLYQVKNGKFVETEHKITID